MNPKAVDEGLLVEELADELVIYDRRRRRAHRLNGAAAAVWKHCDGTRGVSDLVDVLQKETGLPADEGVALLALDRLSRAHLLVQRVSDGQCMSRRQVMRRLGMTGAAAFLLPVVASLSAPTPAMASSSASFIDCSMKICLRKQDCLNASNNQCTTCTTTPDPANPDVYLCGP